MCCPEVSVAVRITDDGEQGTISAETGTILISVDVPNVMIMINGEAEGLAHPDRPLVRRFFPVGKVEINAKAKDHPEQTKALKVKSNEQADILFSFLKDSHPKNELINQTAETGQLTVEQLLQQGDSYYERERYTTPYDSNAFVVYKDVLAKDPLNEKARSRIYSMMERYLEWGEQYRRSNLGRVLFSYQQYLLLAEYALKVFGDRSVFESINMVQQRIKDLTSAHDQIVELLAEGEALYKAKIYIDESAVNAFDCYREVLELEPENRKALNRIRAMMADYRKWGDANWTTSPQTALRHYTRGKAIADYLWEKTRDTQFRNAEAVLSRNIQRLTTLADLFERAEALLEMEYFAVPDNENALIYYRQILQIDPKNQQAELMLTNMKNYCKSMGDRAYSEGNFALAVFYYRQFVNIVTGELESDIALDRLSLDYYQVLTRIQRADQHILLKRIDHQKYILQQNLIQYHQLKQQESSDGSMVSVQIMAALKTMIEDLHKIELLYEQLSAEVFQLEKNIAQVRKTKLLLKTELNIRMNKSA